MLVAEKDAVFVEGSSIFSFLRGIPGYQMTSEELKIIESLLRLKALKRNATADNISFDSHIPKAKVYGAMKLLESKRFVTKVPGERPAVFKLIEPKDLKVITDKVAAQTDSLMKKYAEDYEIGVTTSVEPIFEKIPDREQYYGRATELVSKSPTKVFILSRRGVFYKYLLNGDLAELKNDYEKEWLNVIRDYLITKEGKVFSLITQQTGEETAKQLKKKFGNSFHYYLVHPDKPYQDVTCLLCSDRVLLGWNKGGPQEPTEEGLLIKSPKIYNFISILIESKFGKDWKI